MVVVLQPFPEGLVESLQSQANFFFSSSMIFPPFRISRHPSAKITDLSPQKLGGELPRDAKSHAQMNELQE